MTPGLMRPPDLGESLRGEPAGDAHPLDRVGVLHLGAGVARGALPTDVLGSRDVRRHGPHRADDAGREVAWW